MMEQLLNEYKQKFGEQLPLMLLRNATDEEVISIIKSCLENGKPYEPDLDKDSNY